MVLSVWWQVLGSTSTTWKLWRSMSSVMSTARTKASMVSSERRDCVWRYWRAVFQAFTTVHLEQWQARGCVLCTCSLSLTELYMYIVYYENVWSTNSWIDATGKHFSPNSFIFQSIFSLYLRSKSPGVCFTKRQLQQTESIYTKSELTRIYLQPQRTQ